MSVQYEPKLLLEWEGEEARWRRLSTFLLAIFLQVVLAILIAFSPNLLRSLGIHAVAVQEAEVEPKRHVTFLLYPPSLMEKLRRPPRTNNLSDQNRVARGLAPKINPNGIQSPFSRGNTKQPDLRGGKQKPAPPAPPPSPPQQAVNQPPQKPQPPAPKPQPEQDAQLRLQNVPALRASSMPKIQVPATTSGQAIQQSLEAAVRNRSSGPVEGPGNSIDEFQNANPNFSTSGPIILSDTRGVNFGPYLARVVYIVRQNWYAIIPESARLGEKGRVALVFEIIKDGNVPQLRLVASSGSPALDQAALASIKASNPFPPLPANFTGKHLVLEFIYLYNLNPNSY